MHCATAATRPTDRSAIAPSPTSWTAAALAYTQEEVRWLVGQIETLKPFPDVIAALEKLRTARLHAGDPIERRPRHAQGRRSPHRLCLRPRHLGRRRPAISNRTGRPTPRPRRSSAEDRSSTLFVANHAFDCIGAKAFGMRTAFADRRRRPFGETPHQPDLMVANFSNWPAVWSRPSLALRMSGLRMSGPRKFWPKKKSSPEPRPVWPNTSGLDNLAGPRRHGGFAARRRRLRRIARLPQPATPAAWVLASECRLPVA